MRKLNVFIHSVLLATTPSLLLYPQDNFRQISCQTVDTQKEQTNSSHVFSYDEIMQLLDELESGELEEKVTAEELERINQFVALLATEGMLPDDFENNLVLQQDIDELLNQNSNPYEYAFALAADGQYMVIPALFNSFGEVMLCKSWLRKKAEQVKEFVKKHKKEIIIGAAIIVAATVVVVAIVATTATVATATTAAAATAVASESSKTSEKETPSLPATDISSEAPTLKEAIDERIISFKENLVNEQFFQPNQELSFEENGRALGSLFAHESLKNLGQQISAHPRLSEEAQTLGLQYHFPIPREKCGIIDFGHPEIDRKFATDYASFYAPNKEIDFNTLSYQIRGEKALSYGYYDQAVHDLGKAIELGTPSPLPYLERGMAHFGLGQYDHSLEDYHQYTAAVQKTYPLSLPQFGLGFAKGLPKGIYDSSSGLFLMISDLIQNPIHTGGQMWEALSLLSNLARSEEWGAISQVLAPEIHKLVMEWDTLPSDVRGELAGYAFGKYGADILVPGALAKAVAKGLKGAQQLSIVYKGLQTAEQTLVLESVAALESGAKIGEVVHASQTTIALGEDLGFSAKEMTQLKQAGKLEGFVDNSLDRLVSQSESEVLRTVISQNKHVKMVKDYITKPAKEIQKGINSYEKQIAIHKDKIANPSKYYPEWSKLHPSRQDALINKKWPTEIELYEKQKDLLKAILNERLN